MIRLGIMEAVIAGLLCLTASAEPVWIDTDPACGLTKTSDVDDWSYCQMLCMEASGGDLIPPDSVDEFHIFNDFTQAAVAL